MRAGSIAVVALLGLFAWNSPADALTPEERELIVKSVRPSQLPVMEAAVGGLDALPLLAMELSLDVDHRTIQGKARLDWLNSTGVPHSKIPVRFSAHGGGKNAPTVGWSHVTVTLPDGTPTKAKVSRLSRTVSVITLPKPLLPGRRVIIEGNLSGQMVKIDAGATDPMSAGLSALSGKKSNQASGAQYGTFACGDGICTLEGFAPEVPAFIDGKFDTSEGTGIGDPTYSEVSNLLLSILAPKDVTLVATGFEVGRVPEGALQRTTFAMAATREVGLVASRQFVHEEAMAGDIVVRSFSLEDDADGGRRALGAAVSALQILNDDLGPYPWSFLNVAESALVGGAGGVEMPGLALGASGFYRPDPGLMGLLGGDGDLFGDMLDFITRHEVAHQWWHAQVGSHAQIHPYVDEPLAQWSALHTVRKAKGEAEAKRIRDLQIALNFQALQMMGIRDGKVARPAHRFSNMTEYAGLVYGKAPLFYEALRTELGEDVVLSGLRSLVAKRRFRRTTPDELKESLCEQAGEKAETVRSLWKRWFHETHGAKDVGTFDLAGLAGALGIDGLQGLDSGGGNPFQLLQDLLGGDEEDDEE